MTMRLLRTMLFAPGNRPRMLEKVGQCGADAVILDLEDAVPIADKAATRPAVRAAVDSSYRVCPQVITEVQSYHVSYLLMACV